MSGKRRTWRLVGLLLITLAVWSSPRSFGVNDKAGTVTEVSGPAWVIRENWSYAAVREMILYSGDRMKTGRFGKMTVRLGDRHLLKLYSGTEITLKAVRANQEASLFMTVGKLFVDVVRDIEKMIRFEIESEAAIAGVRGTRFIMKVNRRHKTSVSVYEGEVELIGKQDRSSVILSPGQSSTVVLGGRPSAPKSFHLRQSLGQAGASGRSGNGNGNSNGNGNGAGGHQGGRR
jgi:ferric-dicitrate binding protein FerR (iron transport regulator)